MALLFSIGGRMFEDLYVLDTGIISYIPTYFTSLFNSNQKNGCGLSRQHWELDQENAGATLLQLFQDWELAPFFLRAVEKVANLLDLTAYSPLTLGR